MKPKEFMEQNNLLGEYKSNISFLIIKIILVILFPYAKIGLLFRLGICVWLVQKHLFHYFVSKDVYILRGRAEDESLPPEKRIERFQAELCFLSMENKELKDKESRCSLVVLLLMLATKLSFIFGIAGIIVSVFISYKLHSKLYDFLKS